MRSLWFQALLLIVYIFLVFVISRIIDLVLWYHHGISSTQIVDPLSLSVIQLKHLLENRGVSYAGYIEKRELVQLVEASAIVVQSEVEELSYVLTGNEDKSARVHLPIPPPSSHFRGGPHFYEEVEDTKDSVWLVQVVPAGGPSDEPLLDDYKWRIVCNQIAPFAIRTGVFDCKLDRRLCTSKGWHHPLLLLALPKGTRAKDRVILKTFTSTKPQSIVEWVRDQLSIRVKNIQDIEELKRDWLQNDSNKSNTTSASGGSSISRDVKVLLLTHLLHPPLFLAALSIKFTGRIRFGMFSIKKEESETVKKNLKLIDHKIPSYLIVTPERKVIYGRKRFEHFNFDAMNLFLRAVQPEMNDIFLCSLVFVNMLVSLQIFQISVRLWWKHVARFLWTAVSYNLWHFSLWLLINATYRFFLISFVADKGLLLMRYISLTEIGSLIRSDWQTLAQHPYIIFLSFFVYGFLATWFLQYHDHNEAQIEAESDRPWWEVLPLDSHWINCLFQPMATLTRPLPPSELEFEEGIEMLIERLAIPNLWLQPVIPNEYIKDLPVWKFRSWGSSITNKEEKHIPAKGFPEALENIMDVDDPYESVCQCCIKHNGAHAPKGIKYRHNETTFVSRKKKNCDSDLIHCKCMNSTNDCSATNRSPTGDSYNIHLRRAANVETDIVCSLRINRLMDISTTMVSGDSSSVSCKCNLENLKENISHSEESGDEAIDPPAGMLPATECAVCLETYKWGAILCGLPCGHNYHQCCIMLWLGRDNHHCPVCRWPAYKSKHDHSHFHRE